jgi:hypothetical protein
MILSLTALLILVPAPSGDEAPTGPAPGLQYLKWTKDGLQRTVNVAEMVPVTEAIAVNVNGQVQVRNVVRIQTVFKVTTQLLDANEMSVYDLAGKKVADGDWQKVLGNGAVVLVTTNGELPHPTYRKAFNEGTLIVVLKQTATPAPGAPPLPTPVPPR